MALSERTRALLRQQRKITAERERRAAVLQVQAEETSSFAFRDLVSKGLDPQSREDFYSNIDTVIWNKFSEAWTHEVIASGAVAPKRYEQKFLSFTRPVTLTVMPAHLHSNYDVDLKRHHINTEALSPELLRMSVPNGFKLELKVNPGVTDASGINMFMHDLYKRLYETHTGQSFWKREHTSGLFFSSLVPHVFVEFKNVGSYDHAMGRGEQLKDNLHLEITAPTERALMQFMNTILSEENRIDLPPIPSTPPSVPTFGSNVTLFPSGSSGQNR